MLVNETEEGGVAEAGEAPAPYETITYQYGLLDPVDWDTDCQEHLWLQNKLWNRLVEIERQAVSGYRHILAEDIVYATISERLQERRSEQTVLRDHRKKLRAQARSKVETPEIDLRLLELSREIQPLAGAIKEAATEARNRIDLKALLHLLETSRAAAAKHARKNSGIWWGNYNAVFKSYTVARSRLLKSKGELKFHGHTGEGRFTIQIIGGASTEAFQTGRSLQAAIDLTLLPVP